MLKCLINKVAALQDCCKTYLSHAHLRFYFSLGKTLKKIHQLSIDHVLLKMLNVKLCS